MLQSIRRYLSLDAEDARVMIERVFRDHQTHDFAVRLWDGQEICWGEHRAFTLVFTEPDTLRECLSSRDPARLAEAYVEGRLLVEGDLWAASGLASFLRSVQLPLREKLRLVPKLVVPASPHTNGRDRQDVQAHYDLSDELFRRFLDDKMVYSCAYFEDPEQDLEQAQERKLELVCRKLDLHPGEHLLDVGCGWGALLIWAAKHHGVRAHGITLSERQLAAARHRIAAAGLEDRVTVSLRHYAELGSDLGAEATVERYDKVSSVGMVEHVGLARLPAYFTAIHRVLRPGGLFLNHGITAPRQSPSSIGGAFIMRHVFPGAELTSVAELQARMEDVGFEVLDVQGLRPHYALTLREWFRRFSAHRAQLARVLTERVLRIWDVYLCGCARAFEDGTIGVHQVLVGKPDAQGRVRVPLTREAMAQG